MKKAFLLALILTVSVLSTACINNVAIQKLNNKAAEYMKNGDYENAISRLKSSADLDDSFFETQYNLAVAYTANEDYADAATAFEKAATLNPKSPEVYYSAAVMYENYARDLKVGETKEQKNLYNADEGDVLKNSSIYKPKNDDGSYMISSDEIAKVKECLQLAVSNYEKYLELVPQADDAPQVNAKIEDLSSKINSMNN